MSQWFELAMPWWEFVLRAVVVYVVILVMVRISGKRSVGQYTPFDLILVVLLGTAVQNSLIGEDVSLLGGLLLAATLIALNWLVGLATSRSRRMDRLVEGVPVVLARNGRIYQEALRRENIATSDFDEAMRQADCTKHDDIRLALLETDGKISIVTRERDEA